VDRDVLPLPAARGLTKEEAARYLGIGVTLLIEANVPFLKIGRRCVYDKVDLDAWLDEYKHRGRAGKETLWPVKPESIGGQIPATGGSMLFYQTANDYEEALGLKTDRKPKPSSPKSGTRVIRNPTSG
jgi:hypothetical protein